jgi:hypothetical protein
MNSVAEPRSAAGIKFDGTTLIALLFHGTPKGEPIRQLLFHFATCFSGHGFDRSQSGRELRAEG